MMKTNLPTPGVEQEAYFSQVQTLNGNGLPEVTSRMWGRIDGGSMMLVQTGVPVQSSEAQTAK